jgi:hypothetical protein
LFCKIRIELGYFQPTLDLIATDAYAERWNSLKLDGFVAREPKGKILDNAHFRVDFGSPERQREFFQKAKRKVGRWVDLYAEISTRNSSEFSIRKLK